jgi:nitrate/nitrite-specific signal transduction histidine kinase
MGVSMMIERSRQLGGHCTIEGSAATGTRVRIELPHDAD